jgi:predicted Rossmann-fold nucleotide-binding protein
MAKSSFRNEVGHMFNLIEQNQITGTELIDLLDEVEKVYEHLQEVSSAAHQAQHFSIGVFGSARVHSDCPEFTFVSKLTQSIVEKIDVDIVTGGGAGIMEAANKGIMLASSTPSLKKKARSWGIHVQRFDSKPNPFLHVEKYHKHFTTRLQSFVNLIQGAYTAEGGIGTLLELSLLWQLKQIKYLPADFPLVVAPMWKPILEQFHEITFSQRAKGIPLIDAEDMALIQFSDDIEEIVAIFSQAHQKWKINKAG